MFRNAMEKNWDQRANEDAFYYVDTRRTDWDKDTFFSMGEQQAYDLTEGFFREWGFVPKDKNMLDLGCGVGRLEAGFSKMFGEVWGVDISEEMIKKAIEYNQSENTHFQKINGYDLNCLRDNYFDFAFSYIVLQHVPEKKITYNYFKEIYRILKPGGLFKVQLRRRRLFMYAFGFMPVPTFITPYLPARLFRVYWKLVGKKKGVLSVGKTWGGSGFTESEALKMIDSIGFIETEAVPDHTLPKNTSIWCFGKKPA